MARTKSHLDTNSLQMEWLGAEDAKQDDRGSSVGGREERIFWAKNRLTCDLRSCGCPLRPLPDLKKNPYFSACFLDFLKTTSLLVFYNWQ